MNSAERNPIGIFLLNLIGAILAYYVSLLLHEWGHGFVAWLYEVKDSPFDVQYGGYFLQKADENVDYFSLMSAGRGLAAALIGIGGLIISLSIATIALILLHSKKLNNHSIRFIFVYWFLIINMIPIIQYLSVSPFALTGDTGRFVGGLNISPLWIFIPGTIFLVYLLTKILRTIVPKAYAVIPIKSLLGKNLFLLSSLSMMFLFIYTHGYNPLSDKEINLFTKIIVIISISLVPILFILCNPARHWVKQSTTFFENKKI